MTTQTPASGQTLFLIDSMSLAFQAFYAVRGLTNSEGLPTNAVFGFARRVQNLLSTYSPTHIVAVFDSPGPSFRNEIYAEYKANREEAPEDFQKQVPILFELLAAMAIPSAAMPGFEADDLIGTLSTRASRRGLKTVIVSADKDLFQLVDENVSMLRTRADDMQIYGPNEVKERMGVAPSQMIDYLALVGDASDNIPGVPRIGPKTAVALLEKHGSVDKMLEDLDRVENARQRQLIADRREQLLMSQCLATVRRDVPLDLSPETVECRPTPDSPALIELYRRLGFVSLLRELREKSHNAVEPSEGSSALQAAVALAAVATPETDYRVLTDRQALSDVVCAIREAGRVALDTETTALDTMRAELVGISLCARPGTAWYVPVGHRLEGDAGRQMPLDAVREILGPVLADDAVVKIAQNAKFDLRILDRHGMPVRGLAFDTMLASYLLNPEAPHGLKAMALEILGVEMTQIEGLIGKGRGATTMDQVEIDRAAPYACADADMTLRLADVLGGRLKAEGGLQRLFEEIEIPLVEVLDAMEAEGVTLDAAVLEGLSADFQKRLDALTQEIFGLAKRSFNVKSPKQVAEVLFEELGLKPGRRTKTGQSTRVEVLEELVGEHPLPGMILAFRHLDKLKSTYVDALPQMVNPETGRIHTSYNQFIAATGRLSSSDPNLQNIPVRTADGLAIRRAFVPNEPDHVLLAADYSQIELRVLAHVADDKALREAFKEDRDIHAETAARVFGMPREMVTEDMRKQAKTINFGILYGMSAHRLSRELDIPHGQAQRFIDDYFAAYPGVKRWSEELLKEAAGRGYVTTLCGRRRMTPNLGVSNRNVRANAERMAINTPIQGTAADMIKIAMIGLHREIRGSKRRARMVLQVHDELVFSLPESEVEKFTPVVRGLMENALKLDVPVRVDIKVGRTWAEC
ncbi:DNA polymerase I [Candidatus Sumerlaeota bacterium]|nr:DNA polymerase I [Candidatus Sumerlaeota bacterium]